MATQAKAKWSWRAALRQIIPRSTPYWDTTLAETQDQRGVSTVFDFLVWQVLQVMIFAVTISATAQLAALVFVVPGGLPGVIGGQLAGVCRATGNCDLNYLLASYAVAMQILAAVAILIITSISRLTKQGQWDRREADMAFLDRRFVELRDELMAAGILTKPPEELPEEE